MAVITIEYQMGCGGRDIARTLAEQLGFSYTDREIVKEVARQLHTQEDAVDLHDERVAGIVERTLSLLRIPGELTWVMPSDMPEMDMIDENIYHRTTCQVIEASARQDKAVIAGHGSSFALAGWPGIMHICLYAAPEHRVQTIMKRFSIGQAEALHRVNQRDQEQARYNKRFHHVNWHEARHYHLMIDTSIFVPSQVVDLVIQAWQTSSFGAINK